MRIIGVFLMLVGLLLCLTIFGAIFGIPMMIVGGVLVAMGGRRSTITNIVNVRDTPTFTAGPEPRSRIGPLQPPRIEAIHAPVATYDKAKWQTLVRYDAELRGAAERVRPFGDTYEDELAEAYLQVNDKSYLETIVSKIVREAGGRLNR